MPIISRERFEIITKSMRFDNKETRTERRQCNKLAVLRDMWEQFVKYCRQSFIVSDMVYNDEQVVLTPGRVPFQSLQAKKP